MRICKEVKRLNEYRITNGLTYVQLGPMIGVDKMQVNRWCIGRTVPNNVSRSKIRAFLDNLEKTEQNQRQTELLDYNEQAKDIFEVRMDIDYLHKRLDKAKDIQNLKDLVDELDKIAKMGQLMITRK